MTDAVFIIAKVLLLSALSAVIAFLISPLLIKTLNTIRFWKKKARTKAISGEEASVFNKLHEVRETSVPRGGGVVIWVAVGGTLLVALAIEALGIIDFSFLSRSETWLPLFTLFAAAIVGLIDDILVVFGKGRYLAGGISFSKRLMVITLIGAIGAWWFFIKLGWSTIHVPLVGDFDLGIFYALLFVLTTLAAWASGVVDGIDGLAGGIFLIIFGAFSVIALTQGKYDLAALGGVIMGSLIAFLWFNIPPARFYMGETGALALTTTMAVFAFLTDSLVVLPIIGGVLVIEVGSVVLQLASKKIRKKKIWLSTPIHHHLEAIGWPPYQVSMRLWILGIIFAMVGVALRLLG